MTFHSHISHSFKLSVPLLTILAAIVAVGAFGVFVIDPLVTNDPTAAPFVATLGSGIDEFSAHGGNILQSAMPKDAGGWIASIAVFVTIWSVIKVIRELHGPVGGSGDLGSLTSHGTHRTLIALGVRTPAVSWGVVRDSVTGHPLGLAKVRLVGADGAVMDTCVADRSGRYGFRISPTQFTSLGYRARLETSKSGYYPTGAARELPMLAGAHPALDIAMDRAGDVPIPVRTARAGHHPVELAGTVAFWLGVLLVPLAFLRAPNLLHGVMFGAFAGAGIVRATWRHTK